MTDFWTVKSGTQLATISEGLLANIALPVTDPGSVSVISGQLPPGLEITPGFNIAGTPEEVAAETEFRFVLRAAKNGKKQDRTFSITVLGADAPEWVTPSGLLPVGYKQTLFVLDGSLVNFQLEVVDPDTRAGQTLRYFIGNNGGELPPGLTLTEDGRITGVLEPLLALEDDAGRGRYDENRFDKYPYDFTIQDESAQIPEKLNQFYQFEVSASDGDSITTRVFDIFVVGDDFLRADNTILQVAEGIFTADNTFVRTPIWLTPADLGTRRANNNVTLFLEVLDLPFSVGNIVYTLVDENPDGTNSELPPNCELDENTGEIFGRLPYQAAVSETYTFTVRARRLPRESVEFSESFKTFTVEIIGEIDRTIQWATSAHLGTVSGNYTSLLAVQAETKVETAFLVYSLKSGQLPPGLQLQQDGQISGQIDRSQISQTETFEFEVTARDQFRLSEISRTFTLTVEIDSDTQYSDIFYIPLLKNRKRESYNSVISSPDIFDPDLIYRPNDDQFGIQQQPRVLLYAGLELQQAEQYVAAMAQTSQRRTLQSNGLKTARARLPGTRETVYEVVYVDLIDPYDSRDIKPKKRIKNQKPLLVNSLSKTPNGLIGTNAAYIIVGQRQNEDNKLYLSNTIEIQGRDFSADLNFVDDNALIGRDSTYFIDSIGSSTNINIYPDPVNTIKADTDAILVSANRHLAKYLSSSQALRDSLRSLGDTEREYLPLWMKTPQEGELQELGFTLCLPICYCKPGTSDTIKSALEFNGIDFSGFDIEIDRVVIQETENNSSESYFAFANYEFVLN